MNPCRRCCWVFPENKLVLLVGGACKHFCPWWYSQLAEVLDSLFSWTCLERTAMVLFDQINPVILLFRIPSPLPRSSVSLTLAIIFPGSAMQHYHIYAAKHPVTKMTLLMDLIFLCRCCISSWPHRSQALLRAGWIPLHLCSGHDSPFCEGQGQCNQTQIHSDLVV